MPTGNRTADFVIMLVLYAIMFYCGFDAAFRSPNRIRKAIAEGKSNATEKTVRFVRRAGLFLVVFLPIGILYLIFLHLTGRD